MQPKRYIEKLKSAKIKSYLRFLIAIIPPKLKKMLPAFFYTCFQVGSQKHLQKDVQKKCTSIFSQQQPNVAKYFCGSLPFWLHHRIDPTKNKINTIVVYMKKRPSWQSWYQNSQEEKQEQVVGYWQSITAYKRTLEPSQLVATDTYWLLNLNLFGYYFSNLLATLQNLDWSGNWKQPTGFHYYFHTPPPLSPPPPPKGSKKQLCFFYLWFFSKLARNIKR